jgi:hypothetical protein
MDLEVERIFGLSLVAPSMDMRTKERYLLPESGALGPEPKLAMLG